MHFQWNSGVVDSHFQKCIFECINSLQLNMDRFNGVFSTKESRILWCESRNSEFRLNLILIRFSWSARFILFHFILLFFSERISIFWKHCFHTYLAYNCHVYLYSILIFSLFISQEVVLILLRKLDNYVIMIGRKIDLCAK